MSKQHLPYEAGGDPAANAPVREEANEPPSPQTVDEFPDVPPDNDTDAEDPQRPPDQPDPDAFAARLGIDPEDGTSTSSE